MALPGPNDILDFWFADNTRARWFASDAAFDADIRRRFEALHTEIAGGGLKAWGNAPKSALARVIVLDQLPRNMYRGEARAFRTDGLAVAAASDALARGFDNEVAADRRSFFYLPFMHSERLADQERCVELMRTRTESASGLDFAVRHRDIVKRFGRFPHRNETLGRESTAEELAFLKEPNSSF